MKPTKTPFLHRLQIAYSKATGRYRESIKKQQNPNDIGRREFLQNSALAAVALSIPSFSFSNDPKEQYRVAIIGAGMAGLSAAHTMVKLGLKPMIFEASGRAGGRIFTETKSNGLTRELGAEFIDSNHYDMLSLANEFDLPLYDCAADNSKNGLEEHLFFFGNQKRSEAEIIEEFKKIKDAIEEDKKDYEKWMNVSLADYLKKINAKGWFYDLLYYCFTAEYGLPAERQAALNFIDMISTDTNEGFKIFGDSDERFKVIGGNSKLPEAMAKKMQEHIRYKLKLTAITKAGNRYKLSFDTGKIITADYVLLTLPFTMLRHVQIDPALHFGKKATIIKELEYATNSKLLLETNNRAWRNKKSSGYLINEVIQNGWDNSQLQNKNAGEGGYTIFLGGKEGADLKESDAGNYNKYTSALMKGFDLADGSVSIKPDLKVFNWSTHPFTGGSYACYTVGQWDLAADLASPVGNIYFAGEHCSENFQGFMNGAAETGRVAAEGIIKKIIVACGG